MTMLQRFLFVGLGGSGGKTLRILRQELQYRLRDAGWDGPLPRAWQFLQIDVPAVPDGNESGLPPQLPVGSYVGIAGHNVSYKDLDAMLLGRSGRAVEHCGSWRPDPSKVTVPPSTGAGQYRAVGRVVTAAGLEQVVAGINRAVSVLNHIDTESELDLISQRLGNDPSANSVPPRAIVVSSIAGGAGAGMLLDVCDVLRLVVPDLWTDRSIGILYTPDVFGDLMAANRSGVQANALAVISELMAGYWNKEPGQVNEFALLEGANVAVSGGLDRRGPRYPLLVGRSNGAVHFAGQNDVYRAVGRSLAAWATSARLQDTMRAYLEGNWPSDAANVRDKLGLAPTEKETPFSSFGFASLSLGRERFARYASERLARAAVERLLRAHWTDKVREGVITPDAAAERVVEGQGIAFLERCGLRELGPDHNQILDALRGGDAHSARRDALRSAHAAVTSGAKQGRTEFAPEELKRAVVTQLEGRWSEFVHSQRGADEERAKRWVEEVQGRILDATAENVARLGAPVTLRLLDNAIDELQNSVVPELLLDAESKKHVIATTQARVAAVLAGFAGNLLPDNPLIDKAVKEGTDSLWAESEAGLLELAAGLVTDLVDHYLRPLRDAVERARSGLAVAEQPPPGVQSPIQEWSLEAVPQRYHPAQNELLLEEVDTYPDSFLKQVKATLGSDDEGGALIEAVQQIIVGTRDKVGQTLVEATTKWIPAERLLRTTTGARAATFEVHCGAEDLLSRASEWVVERDTAMGMFVHESLVRYLDPATAEPGEHASRLERFRAELRQALETSLPLVSIDEQMLGTVHDLHVPVFKRLASVLPFPAGHPARKVATEVLLGQGLAEKEAEGMFGDAPKASSIEISTFLATPYQPVVFNSLMGPIAAEWAGKRDADDLDGFWRWRRARPLSFAIPVAPETRLQMIRGWFVARILNQLDTEEPRGRAARIFVPDRGWMPFPYPVLGAPPARTLEVLPAVLESLSIALVEMSSRGEDAVRPYQRLAELGKSHDGPVDYAELPHALRQWCVTGETPGAAPLPKDNDAGSPSSTPQERVGRVAAFIDTFQSAYQLLDLERVDADSALRLTRAWELRHDLVLALEQLQGQCARTATGLGEPGVLDSVG